MVARAPGFVNRLSAKFKIYFQIRPTKKCRRAAPFAWSGAPAQMTYSANQQPTMSYLMVR